MDEHLTKSLASRFDLMVQNIMKCLDTSIERDFIQKLNTMDELINGMTEDSADLSTIKNQLKDQQDECSKLSYKLKTSANSLDKVVKEKKKMKVEKETIKSQLKHFYNIFKRIDIETHHSQSNSSNVVQRADNNILNNTDALFCDISYSHSEDSSSAYENEMKKLKPNSVPTKKYINNNKIVPINNLNDVITKKNQTSNININNNQIIAETPVTVDIGSLNVKSVIKTLPVQSSKGSGTVSWLSSDAENEVKLKKYSSVKNTEKDHSFKKTNIIVPGVCGGCHTIIKLNSFIVKCLDCKIVGHLECKHLILGICTFDKNQINTLNCHIPTSIVYCINEIERKGFNTIGLYRISGSDKEVKRLKEQFLKGVPNLDNVDIHVLCSCLKVFIRMHTGHLISQNNFSYFADILKNYKEISKEFCQGVIELPLPNRSILAFLILHLKKVADSSKCRMDYNCLAIVFGPTIVGFSSTSLQDIHIETQIVIKVVTELLKLTNNFWISVLNTTEKSDDKLPLSTLVQSQSSTTSRSIPAHRTYFSGRKR